MIGRNLPRPEPSAGTDAYIRAVADRLAHSPQTRKNYERCMSARFNRKAVVDYLPVKLDIENVSRCNFRCTMCAVSGWPKGKRADDMILDHFKAIIDENYGLVEIKLNGLGEALMQGDDYFEMIRYARARKIWVRITTNASLLGVRDNYLKLVDSGVNEIDISIDGHTKEIFESIRVGSNFRVVTDNCRLLNSVTSLTKMWTLVQRENSYHLFDHVELAYVLGFKHLVFSLSMHGWGDQSLSSRNKAAMSTVTEEQAWLLVGMGRKLGVKVSFWDVAEKFSARNPCPWPFERYVATSDSRITPCCMIGNPDKFEIKGGWDGAEYREFRQDHIDGNVPVVCKGCYRS